MEGDPGTGDRNGNHANGYIDLRDPDTGGLISKVTTAATFSFARFSTTFSAKPTTAANDNIDNIVQLNFCLKCHDSDGMSYTGAYVSGGSAFKPFANLTSVRDVNAHFATANASAHPIRGPRSNSYINTTDGTILAVYGVAKTKGTRAPGKVMTCWDCHNASSGALWTTKTVNAHGGTVTLRAPLPVYGTAASGVNNNTGNLCGVCHLEAQYNTATANTAFSSNAFGNGHGDMHGSAFTCNHCHGSSWLKPITKVRAEDAHGFNTMLGGAATFGATGSAPYAFLRNNAVKGAAGATSPYWAEWRPRRAAGATVDNAGGWGCKWNVNGGASPCSHSEHLNTWSAAGGSGTNRYLPGGVF
jgi:nitrate reductase cytochrome c-type subunit